MQNVKKRFTDTRKWEKEWFLSLECGDKLVWLYLLDTCDEAGLWNANWRLCSILTGVDLDGCPKALKHQLVKTNHDKVLYIKDFMDFQYPDYMVKRSPMIAKCVRRLIKYGVVSEKEYSVAQSNSQSDYQSDSSVATTVQEKEKEKEKVKVKEIVKDAIVINKIDVSLKSIDVKFLDDLQAKHMDIDVEEEFIKFKDYLASKGKTYKNYQAAFRNWIKSNFVPKSDKVKNEMLRKKQQEQDRIERERLNEQVEKGEIGGPPPEFFEDMKKLTKKFSVNKEEKDRI
tara:strand:+ start:369 stop:1223 length:855 start_codon:yes stop_codon:yes gene_type:complete